MTIRTVDFDQLMNQAKVTLLGASEAGLKGAFFDVLSEFFNDSSCWTQDVDFQALTTSTEYPLEVNEGQIIRLVGVSDDQNGFIPALMADVGTVLLRAAPNSDTTYTATFVTNVALPTLRGAIPNAPDWTLPLWHTGILDGLLGRMMIQPNKSYSNLTQAPYHLKRFRDVVNRARISKLRAFTNGAQAWRYPQQFRTSNQQGGVPSVGSTGDRRF